MSPEKKEDIKAQAVREYLSERARLAGKARMKQLTNAQRSELGRAAVASRWEKTKKAKPTKPTTSRKRRSDRRLPKAA